MRIIQRRMKLFDCRAVLVIVGMAAMTANATLRTWVGASGGSWYAAENWDPSGIPAETDTVVFRPDSELTVKISATSGNEAGLASDVTPISAPTISFNATTALEADVVAYRAAHRKKSQIVLATASTSLVLPGAVTAAANAWSSGCRFVKSGNSLILEVAGTDGFYHHVPLRRVS